MTTTSVVQTGETKARKQNLNALGHEWAEIDISSGEITVDDKSLIRLSAESGTEDELTQINLTDTAADTQGVVILVQAATGNTITISSGGNIATAGIEMTAGDVVLMFYDGFNWIIPQVGGASSGSGGNATRAEAMFISTADGTVEDSTSETTLIGTGIGSLNVVADSYSNGSTYRITARGYHERTSGTLTVNVKFGSTVLTTGAITLSSAASATYFEVSALITVRSTGSSGTLYSQGIARFGDDVYPLLETSSRSVDTTSDQTIDVTATWSAASVDNTITCTNLLVEAFERGQGGVAPPIIVEIGGTEYEWVLAVGSDDTAIAEPGSLAFELTNSNDVYGVAAKYNVYDASGTVGRNPRLAVGTSFDSSDLFSSAVFPGGDSGPYLQSGYATTAIRLGANDALPEAYDERTTSSWAGAGTSPISSNIFFTSKTAVDPEPTIIFEQIWLLIPYSAS